MTTQKYPVGQHPNLPPPNNTVGVLFWLKENMFNGVLNSILTLFSFYVIITLLPPLLKWAIIYADWTGDSKDACTKDGACWVFIRVWFDQLLYGRYPSDSIWRINLSYVIAIVAAIPLFFSAVPKKIKLVLAAFLLVVYPIICFYLYYGGGFGLEVVETPRWGGLFLTLVIAVSGIVLSLPLGILLALGRRSNMPVIKSFCVVFIEFWRGIPLITVLFMASVMFPLFVPESLSPDKLLRVLVGVILFSSAYMAEVVRGGLQAIPKGQYEAAAALGLNYPKSMILIILPQALKMVIPGIVNTFIGLFKDTTLVLIIGLFDLLGMAQLAATNPNWLGFTVEGYVFAAVGFFVFCFSMSSYSQHLERVLNTGHRN
ncbi:amino acid ABC transporter permease [Reinekea marinisedimentorum]|uniref:General L-amino acid transport system permease protein n=1 Tax=Reinekea marinisedimentorum TaxID=230495 RepID=A0A4R3IE59_9GAMM|nr:amino acid ABC transporter permease [Reinekea marinisedimentorum]TCS43071.1 general L-amino acid transport system permease protein [Reinekea marinisedimentorum]